MPNFQSNWLKKGHFFGHPVYILNNHLCTVPDMTKTGLHCLTLETHVELLQVKLSPAGIVGFTPVLPSCHTEHCTLHCTLYCILQHTAHFTILLTALYCTLHHTAHWTIMHDALYCTLNYTAQLTILHT